MTLFVQVSEIDVVLASETNHGGDYDEGRRFLFPFGNDLNIRARIVVSLHSGSFSRSDGAIETTRPTPPHPSRPSAIVPYFLVAISDFDRPFLVWHPSMPRPIPRPLFTNVPLPSPPYFSTRIVQYPRPLLVYIVLLLHFLEASCTAIVVH